MIKRPSPGATKSPIYYIIGNALEFYDFTIFALFTPLLGSLFFPSKDPFFSLLFGLTVLASAFVARPFGGILFGHLADKFGRKISLITSLSVMAISTLGIGLLPTPHEIGMVAPILLFLFRFSQGLSAGGEYCSASVLLMEVAPPKRRSFWGAFVPLSCGMGGLLAAFTSVILQYPSFPLGTWRIAFILGGCLGFLALWLRIKISESPEFESIQQSRSKTKLPILVVFKNHNRAFRKTFILSSFYSCLISYSFVYINIYLHQSTGLSMNRAIFYNQFCLLFFILSSFIFGYYSDSFKKEFLMRAVIVLVTLVAYPLFLCLYSGNTFLIVLAQCVVGILTGAYAACINGYMYKLFPPEIRTSGIGLGYSLGMALIGSTVPIIASLLINKFDNPMMPAIYLILIGITLLIIEILPEIVGNIRFVSKFSKTLRNYG